MVITYFPPGDFLVVFTVRVDVAVPPELRVTGFGLNVPVLFAGKPVTERVTLPAKVFSDFREME
jgi:hypothetical protein